MGHGDVTTPTMRSDALMMLETGHWSRTTGSDDLMDMGQLSSLLDTDLDPANTRANSGG